MTLHARAAHAEAAPPHHLRVVSTHLTKDALVGVRVVELVLSPPRLDCLGSGPVVLSTPEYVLTVGTKRVQHLTFVELLGGHAPSVACQVPVPRKGWLVELFSYHVVRINELARERYVAAAAVAVVLLVLVSWFVVTFMMMTDFVFVLGMEAMSSPWVVVG